MRQLFFLFLGLHLLGVVIAYGSTLLMPLLLGAAPAGGRGGLAGYVQGAAERLALPAATSMPFTGAALVLVAGINPASQAWLGISILLYAGTLAYLVFRQRPRLMRALHGERSPALLRELRHASLGVVAVILVIAGMMIVKPGR